VDINSAVGREQGISDPQLAALANFESSAHFNAQEKTVLRYTEGMTQNPAEVAEPVFEELKRYFNTAQIVELTTMIAFENLRARFNRALHIEADGFCELPADHPVRKAVAPWQSS
jgi:alkylhydroperoxidase family enzyme